MKSASPARHAAVLASLRKSLGYGYATVRGRGLYELTWTDGVAIDHAAIRTVLAGWGCVDTGRERPFGYLQQHPYRELAITLNGMKFALFVPSEKVLDEDGLIIAELV